MSLNQVIFPLISNFSSIYLYQSNVKRDVKAVKGINHHTMILGLAVCCHREHNPFIPWLIRVGGRSIKSTDLDLQRCEDS